MKQTRPSVKQYRDSSKPPEGQPLQVKHNMDGLTQVKLDNGVPHAITILTRTEDFPALMGSDLAAIREHLMTRKPGHFRSKRTS
jgi:hypothetical protein